jgi:predicted NUDIX family NTP pyrophosphohydrolase
VLIGHMGGPFWARRDERAWSIPKGEYAPPEAPLAAARREFREELGLDVPDGELIDLGEVVQRGGKVVHAWAVRGHLDPDAVVPGTFRLEVPPRSGRFVDVPELDRVAWVDVETARRKLITGQVAFLDRLLDSVGGSEAATRSQT